MGQKVNPIAFRTGVMTGWKSRWYASKQEFGELLVEDQKIRNFIKKRRDDGGKPMYPADRQDRDRADAGRGESRPFFRPARRAHRAQGGAGGGAAERAAEPHRTADQHQDRGDLPPGTRGPTGRRGHCRATGEAGQLPPDDEARHRADHGGRGQGGQDPVGRTAWRRGDVAAGEADCRVDAAVDLEGQDRLRAGRGVDPPGPHRRAGLDQPGHIQRGRLRWH